MADLRDFQAPFFDIYKTLSRLRTSTRYQQICALGADGADLCIKNGLIASTGFGSSMCIRRLAAEKSGGWRVASDFVSDFGDLSDWAKIAERLLAGARNQSDPRPAFSENPKVEELPGNLAHYDPLAAQMLAPVIFHYAFQTLSPALDKGFRADCRFRWTHGGQFWNGAPMPFAWNDANGFYFGPQTTIDLALTLYHPEYPYLRRFLRKTSYRINDIPDLTGMIENLTEARNLPLLRWSAKNIDRIVFMPSAMAPVARALFGEILENPDLYDKTASLLSSTFELADAPDSELFERKGIIDACGCSVQPIVLAASGRCGTHPTAKNGHAADFSGGVNIFAPVLRSSLGSSDVEDIEWNAQSVSRKRPGRILVVEKTCVNAGKILIPDGGVLWHEGRLMGHVAIPPVHFELSTFFNNSRALGKTVRCGGLGACGAEMLMQ